mmetsp:Transcript_36362/g.100957  ORF Transcript_36362/g.100957 Transcript_36362/m.100957 type:complete len:316 (-) Transcript_36362:225-1172(-)
MGQVLSAPITTKESGDGCAKPKGLAWGCSCMQGWRVQMEDTHFALSELPGDGWEETAAFCVMDGHGGKEVARFCERHLPGEIANGSSADPSAALVTAFHRMDEMLGDASQSGDLRVYSDGSLLKTLGMEAPAVNPDWAGGSVIRQQVGPIVQFRVNGNLNLSRSIGDLQYKKKLDLEPCEQIICATPDVRTYQREAEDEFLIVACDGVWDVLGSQDAVNFVHDRLPRCLKAGLPLSSIMEEMLDRCISPDLTATNGLGGDNMTAMLVLFSAAGSAATQPVAVPALRVGPTDAGSVVDEATVTPAGLCSCKRQMPV